MTFRPIDLDNVNSHLGKEVARAALFSILSHEVAHIVKGHFEFKKSIEFLQFMRTEEDEILTLKSLEMDADRLASSTVCSFFEEYSDWVISERAIPLCPVKLKNQFRQAYLLGIYIALIFQDTIATNLLPPKYPITYARFLTSVSVMRYLFRKHYPDSLNLIDETRILLIDCFLNLSGDIKYLGHPMAANFCISPDEDDAKYMYSAVGEAGALASLEPLDIRLTAMKPHIVTHFKSDILVSVHNNPDYYPPKNKEQSDNV